MTKKRTTTLLEWVVAMLAMASLLIWLVTDWHTAGIVVQALCAVAACCMLLLDRGSGREEPARVSHRGERPAQRSEGRNGRGRGGRAGREVPAGGARRVEEPNRQQPGVRNRADVKTAAKRGETTAKSDTPDRQQPAAGVKEGDASVSSRRRRRNRTGRGEAAAAEQPAKEPSARTEPVQERPADERPRPRRAEREAASEESLRAEVAAAPAAQTRIPDTAAPAEDVQVAGETEPAEGARERAAAPHSRSRHRRRAPRTGGEQPVEQPAGTTAAPHSGEGPAELDSNATNKPTE